MIRPFHLRDLTLVHRLGERGVIFQTQAALTSIPHPARRAFVHMLVGGRYITLVWKSEQRNASGFVQFCCPDGNANAHLVYVGTESHDIGDEQKDEIDVEVWLSLLDEMTAEAGRHGIHNLIAEAAEDGPELIILRQAGFAVYTRQDIWICEESGHDGLPDLLMPKKDVDDWDISVLYSNIVPGLIQSVEPNPPISQGKNWVLREGDDLAAFVHINPGPVAHWMRLLIHPNARTKPRLIIASALEKQSPSVEQPVYCCVRRYQSWLQSSLEKAGFRLWGSQAVLVKHIVRHATKQAPIRQTVLEPNTVPGSTPLIQGFGQTNGRNGS